MEYQEALDIVRKIDDEPKYGELFMQYIGTEWKKVGTNYKTICPFHNEKSPSFNYSSEKKIFKCFGCGKGGGHFNIFQEYFNNQGNSYNFFQAIKEVLKIAGEDINSTNETKDPNQGKLKL